MRFVAATAWVLAIPFAQTFVHHASKRAHSESVVLELTDETGVRGYGEAAPRPYVTGETVGSVLADLEHVLRPALPCEDLKLSGTGNAARCALQLAMVDCRLRLAARPATDLVRPQRDEVVYSGVLTAGPLDAVLAQARWQRRAGLTQFKVKVGAGPGDDVVRIRALRELLGPEVSLRLDANGGWDFDQAVQRLRALAPLEIAAVEEPLPRGPIEPLRRLREVTGIPVMADETVVTLADLETLVEADAIDAVNVRVSKCGGLDRSLEIARLATASGLTVQVGCHVGETAILAAAGRVLAAGVDRLAFAEGSYGTLLLVEDVTTAPVGFGRGGRASVLTGAGLGVDIDPHRLEAHAQQVVQWST